MSGDGAASALQRLAAHGGDGFPHLIAARERTDAGLAALRARFAAARAIGGEAALPAGAWAGGALPADAAVVLFGSWGRGELTQGSDDDWLLLVDGPPRDGLDAAVAAVAGVLGGERAGPGPQGSFGTAAFGRDLVEHIGLEDDDNRNLTQRMLLMLESVPVVGDDVHRAVWQQILDRYLSESRTDRRPPRFFLNDVMRYWRTIAVDFAGKHRETDAKWGLRNAKLRTSRKMLFAGGLVPILRCHALKHADAAAFLARQLALPATDRVADAFLAAGQHDAGVRCLGAYDRWTGMLGDPAVRDELSALDRETASASPTFREVRRLAAELQNGLLALLFETPLAPAFREYAIF
ncbi:MAG TPA: nucleotidyltransferase domain-containing protein [Baekduia sp.]|uniref:nucleotidyltransferase domain-containing protein n=1 Tax=Baekduia sp. TaxID=2600305 RepID=UPI002D77A719|nr:nucleotidyltransferase domain-containing protein [Baekduia sp.]HET6509361.1 nucleotidyltransferase domain-containing protein [Baekduia sp.]